MKCPYCGCRTSKKENCVHCGAPTFKDKNAVPPEPIKTATTFNYGCFHVIWYAATFFLTIGWIPVGMIVGTLYGTFWGILTAIGMIILLFIDLHFNCWTEDQQGNKRNWKGEIVEI